MYGHVLDPEEFLTRARYDSAAPEPRLRRWVERYWSVSWELGPDRACQVATLDEPSVHLTREWGGIRRDGVDGAGTWITGPVTRGRFDVTQLGSGGVLGVRFRPGGTTAFADADLSALRDAAVPAAAWFGDDLPPADLPGTATRAAGALDVWLLARAPREDPGYAAFCDLLALLEEPEITGTALLEQRSGLSIRSLQRRFRRFVGVGPKHMLLRSRVMDAVAAIDGGDPRGIGDLAQDLGWFDQSHFLRDFRAVTGRTPSSYAGSRGDGGAGILLP
ncbi:helix-turn-helix domain-containing protein [Brachybacterium sacelli]|uniref:AraC-like DNA-binding protein n=1 Tax=Brachybacterium sacelli TaxID=173364 RepID=A0ABS4X665_9MICO|nr:helix-turn-helix domain-containing protein [Brachybacterium sacelli]MBP2383952.1 AraC-like DNA-binding protein [Brachybacterium sacelli]